MERSQKTPVYFRSAPVQINSIPVFVRENVRDIPAVPIHGGTRRHVMEMARKRRHATLKCRLRIDFAPQQQSVQFPCRRIVARGNAGSVASPILPSAFRSGYVPHWELGIRFATVLFHPRVQTYNRVHGNEVRLHVLISRDPAKSIERCRCMLHVLTHCTRCFRLSSGARPK